MKVFFAIIVAYLMLDGSFGKKKPKKPPPMNRKQKFAVLFDKINDLQQNVSALWARIDVLSQMESRGSDGVHIHSSDGHVEHLHHTEEEGHHLHMHMHVDSDCEHMSHDEGEYVHAHCEMKSAPELGDDHGSNVHGKIHLMQPTHGGPVEIDAHLSGFDMTSRPVIHNHAFHIHIYGDLSEGCGSLGPPYDNSPEYESNKAGHIRSGDFGNITCDDSGNAVKHLTNNRISLQGYNSVLGRSLVVHALPYTDGTKGSAGRHISCCVIGRSGSHDLHAHNASQITDQSDQHNH